MSILALFKNEIVIVQTSLIGSILSNLLLVMGMSFFVGGVTRMEQNFNVTVAQTASSLLALAVGSLIIPTAFHTWSGSMFRTSPLYKCLGLLTVSTRWRGWHCRNFQGSVYRYRA